MFDELRNAVTHLREVSSRIEIDVVAGKDAAELVGIADEIRRAGDSLRTVAVGQVERTNSWKGEGAKSITEWLALETDCPQYEAQAVVLLAALKGRADRTCTRSSKRCDDPSTPPL